MHWIERISRGLGRARLRVDEPVAGVLRLRLSSPVTRLIRMEAAAYLVGPLLIDSGFAHARGPLVRFLADRSLSAICLTHHHEDHAGSCGVLAAEHRCPVYLRNPSCRFEEGLSDLRLYRLAWWGTPGPFTPGEMPEQIEAGGRVLQALPAPGHSATHTAFFDPSTRAIFTGDLLVSKRVSAVMFHENPYQSIASLRRVAALEPSWMLSGHGLAVASPASMLRRKADAMEEAAAEVRAEHARHVSEEEIVRRVFRDRGGSDRWTATLTSGEFSRLCFVRACIRHATG